MKMIARFIIILITVVCLFIGYQSQQIIESGESQKHDCLTCDKGNSGETMWCSNCAVGYIDGKMVLTFWTNKDITDVDGLPIFGVEQMKIEQMSTPKAHIFVTTETNHKEEKDRWVYGWNAPISKNTGLKHHAVWRFKTLDGVNTYDFTKVFANDNYDPKTADWLWQGASVVYRPTDGYVYFYATDNIIYPKIERTGVPCGKCGDKKIIWPKSQPLRIRGYRSPNGVDNWGGFGPINYNAPTGFQHMNDGLSIMWHPQKKCFIGAQTIILHNGLLNKKIPDNLCFGQRVVFLMYSKGPENWYQVDGEFNTIKPGGSKYDPEDLEFYRGTPFSLLGRYAMFLNHYRSDTYCKHMKNRHGTELAISDDGLRWQRPFANINVMKIYHKSLKKKGKGDDKMFVPQGIPIGRHGNLFFYDHDNYGYVGTFRDTRVFYVMGDEECSFTSTGIFEAPKGQLVVNVKTENNGYLKAVLLDPQGDPIEGYELSNSIPVEGKNIQYKLEWNTKEPFPEGKLKIRFYLNNARLYSVREM